MIEGQELMIFDKQMRLGSKEHQSYAAMKVNGVKGKREYRAFGKNDKPCRYFTQYSLECKSKEDVLSGSLYVVYECLKSTFIRDISN